MQLFKRLVLSTCALVATLASFAKDGYSVKGTINNNNDTMVYLCYYYGNGTTVQKLDSAKLAPGAATFNIKGDKKITSGIYMLLFADKSQQVEFMLENGKPLEFTFSKGDFTSTFKSVIPNPENDAFYGYKNFLTKFNTTVQEEQTKLAACKTKEDTTKQYEKSTKVYDKINEEITAYRDDMIAKNQGNI